jgi:hypothetical protein
MKVGRRSVQFPQRLCSRISKPLNKPANLTKEIYMSKTRRILIVLSVFTFLFLHSSLASAQSRTVVVSPMANDPIASGTALRNVLANIPAPSSTNRWLLKVDPGIYQISGDALVMRSWVDIEGSGIDQTLIRTVASEGIPTVVGASNAELRMLTVESTAGSDASKVTAMFNSNANPRVYRVKFVAQNSGVAGPLLCSIRHLHPESKSVSSSFQ